MCLECYVVYFQVQRSKATRQPPLAVQKACCTSVLAWLLVAATPRFITSFLPLPLTVWLDWLNKFVGRLATRKTAAGCCMVLCACVVACVLRCSTHSGPCASCAAAQLQDPVHQQHQNRMLVHTYGVYCSDRRRWRTCAVEQAQNRVTEHYEKILEWYA